MAFEQKIMREQHGPFREQHRPSHEGPGELRFKSYDIVRRIDVGGMGEVYLARQQTAFDREVAIKIIRSDLVYDVTARQRFRREAEVNAYIRHEHILSLIEFGTSEDGRLFFVTPYIAGGTLAQRLRVGALSPSEVYQLFVPLVQAVAYIHQQGVIHRDLKPSNILLDLEVTPGQIYVRLMDFGIAGIQGATASPPLTTSGHEMGTVAYMAPERFSGIVAPSNDIYSLGIILFQMITGQLPSAEYQEPVPVPLEYVIKHCVATEPEDRFATAEELLETFEEAYHYLQGHPQPSRSQRLSTFSLTAAPASIAPIETDDVAPGLSVQPGRPHVSRPPIGIHQQEVKTGQRVEKAAEPGASQLSSQLPSPTFASSTALPPLHPNNYKQGDHESPTVNFQPADILSQRGNSGPHPAVRSNSSVVPVPGKPHLPVKPRRNRLVTAIALLSVLILLVMAALLFFAFQTIVVPSATISFAPRVQAIKQVFTFQAKPSSQAVDVTSASIPAKLFVSKKTGTKTSATTGQSCFLFICQQAVAASDESNVIAQVKVTLVAQINQDLQNQIQTNSAHAVSTVQTTDVSETTTPSVGAVSKTVTVALTEEGQVEYIFDGDTQQLARGLLLQQAQLLGGNYSLINTSVQIGHPVVENINTDGVVTLKIAAVGLVQYNFPKSQLSGMQNAMKGLKLAAALAYLRQQPGVDTRTVTIHLSSGDTMPADIKQMQIVPINPASLPPLSLPTVVAPATVTATANTTPTN